MRSLALAVLVVGAAAAKDSGGRYREHDKVPLVANKVGPFSNPHETYAYYSLPFCEPDSVEHQDHDLGELLAGDRRVLSAYDIRFGVDVPWRELCTKTLHKEDLEKFVYGIENEYYFELFLDGLPMWGYIGEMVEDDFLMGHASVTHHFLFTHLQFTIGFNDDRVVEVNVTTDPAQRVELTSHDSLKVSFTFGVTWKPVETPFEKRGDRYVQNAFLPGTTDVHWLSVVNSFVLVVLLVAFLAVVLARALRADMSLLDEEDGLEDESGWKHIHGDVFRPPRQAMVLSAAVGAGTHLLLVAASTLALAVLGTFHPQKRGGMLTAILTLYSLFSPAAGYLSARLYKQLGGTNWTANTVLSAALFPAPLAMSFAWVNTTAIAHGSTAALPFGTIVVVVTLFLIVAFPLHVIGAITGRSAGPLLTPPCRTKKITRQVPRPIWYRRSLPMLAIAGFLPFSAIYIELHYIFASIWGHKIYTLFGILAVAFVLLVLVTAFTTLALAYFQLCAEDHRWWWRALLSGASAGLFVYAYCFFYFFHTSDMSGLMQASVFFGYMAVISFGFSLMLGAVGFLATFYFVHYIYASVKSD